MQINGVYRARHRSVTTQHRQPVARNGLRADCRALISCNEHKYVEHGDNRSCTFNNKVLTSVTHDILTQAQTLAR